MSERERSLVLVPMSQVKSSKQEFLDAGQLIPLGAPGIWSGRGAVGKSTLALDYAAKVSTGTLEGYYYGQPRTVLLIQHEDDQATQVKPRLEAAKANMENIIVMLVRERFEGVETDEVPSLSEDMPRIRQAIEETNAALVIIDPLTSSVEGDLHKVADVRRALNPLGALARDYALGVICLMHVRKGHAARSDKTSGSHAFRDAARSLLVFAHDEQTGHRVVTVDKSSYAAIEGTSFAFDLVPVDIPTDDGNLTSVARVEHLGVSEVSVDALWERELATSGDDEPDAHHWLREYLEDRGGKALARDIFKAASADGYGKRTIQRAGGKLTEKVKQGYQGATMWVLKDDTQKPKDAIGDNSDTFDTFEETVSPLPEICPVCGTHSSPANAAFGYVHPGCGEEGN